MGHTLDGPRTPDVAETDTAQLPREARERGRLGQAMGILTQSPGGQAGRGLCAPDPPALRPGGHCELSPEVGAAEVLGWKGPQAIETAERPATAPQVGFGAAQDRSQPEKW